jgi:hypothetical protein
MKTGIKFIAAVLLSAMFTSPAFSGEILQEHEVTPFSRLTISGNTKAELIQGAVYSVFVEGAEEDQKLVTIGQVRDEALRISAKGGNQAVVRITVPELSALLVQDAATLTCKGQFFSDTFLLEGKGAATIQMRLATHHLTLDLSGAATATLHGATEMLSVKLAGATQARLDSLIADQAYIMASGASYGKLNVTEKAGGRVAGVATVTFVEEPPVMDVVMSRVSSNLGEFMSEPVPVEGVEEDLLVRDAMHMMQQEREKAPKKFNGHFKGLEIGVNTLIMPDGNFTLQGDAAPFAIRLPASRVWNLNLYEANLPLIRQQFGLVTGAGFEFNTYKFEENIILTKKDGRVHAIYPENDLEFSRNNLTASYVKIPLMLEFQTNSGSKKNSFHIAGGVNFGLRLGSGTKYKYSFEGKTVKEKVRDRYYLNPYRIAAVGKIGWGKLNLFAEYNLLPFFEKGRGPEMHAVSFGIALNTN